MDEIAALRFDRVRKRHAGREILRGVDLALAPGAMTALIGLNGAGKTTLLNCLLDLCRPDAGSITLFGQASDRAASRARLAFLPERFSPPGFLTGDQFVRMFLGLHGVARGAREIDDGVGALDLEPRMLRRPVRGYSKGMAQALGLAACFLAARDLLVLDEPMSGLDPRARALVKRELRRLHARGTAVLFTSHALADVDELGAAVAVLDGGIVRFEGAPGQLRAIHRTNDLEKAFLACVDRCVVPRSPCSNEPSP